ncbi:MAG: hypothetical protein NVSMB18_13360 [Acetobacteraceae bacterium]
MLPRRMHFAIALPPAAETGGGGGTDFIHALAPALRALGHAVDLLPGQDPHFPTGARPVIDGMLLPRLQHRAEALAAADAVVLIHHIAAAAGRDQGAREAVLAVERATLPRFRTVIATSTPVAERLQSEFGVPARVLLPGAHDLPRNPASPAPPVVLAVGVLTRRKGHDLLLRAMAGLIDLDWRLLIAGDAGREPQHAAELAAMIEELGLARRATLLADPTPDALQQAWRSAGLFALATRWEGYPTSVAEALRRGLPVAVTGGDDMARLVPEAAGAVCAVGDAVTFGKCLRRMIFDHALRADMAAAAWQAGQDLPGWTQRGAEFIALVGS